MDLYQVDLRNIAPSESVSYDYFLDDRFFQDLQAPEVQQGCVKVDLTIERKVAAYEFTFHLEGEVKVICDRCLEGMMLPVDSDNRLIVKLGEAASEESDELIVVSHDDPTVDLSWLLYEFVALAIPIKHTHKVGECDETMMASLRKHLAIDINDEDEDDEEQLGGMDASGQEEAPRKTDPRWDALKQLK